MACAAHVVERVDRIRIARRRSREWLAFDVGDAADLSTLAPASFDVVVLNAVFHWLPDKPRALGQFHQVLKKKGRIGLTTRPPGERTLLQEVRLEVLAEPPFGELPRAADRSLFRVDADEMRRLLKQAGFARIEVELTPLAEARDLRVLSVYGGVGYDKQKRTLRRGVDVLVACPGRLRDLIDHPASGFIERTVHEWCNDLHTVLDDLVSLPADQGWRIGQVHQAISAIADA